MPGPGATIDNGAIINADVVISPDRTTDAAASGVAGPGVAGPVPGPIELDTLRVTRLIGADTELVFDLDLNSGDPDAQLS